MVFEQQKQLDLLNTFKVSARAQYFYQFSSVEQLMGELDKIRSFDNRLVLGGGSNILFVGDYLGLVLYPQLFGIDIIEETDKHVCVSVGASENWHEFVVTMTEQGFYGLENLALIPGTVGASPVQNIGAYGVEVKDVLRLVECVDLNSGELLTFSNHECEFDYRDSRFKKAGQGRYIVTRVEFNLTKTPQTNTSYQPLSSIFGDSAHVSPLKVLKKVCEIRQ
ncbi:MAG: FAD-binding protein, partial [Kangiellaceae bacterium]|nr:FAD-binding protein [Kangiellaceae bacterium]